MEGIGFIIPIIVIAIVIGVISKRAKASSDSQDPNSPNRTSTAARPGHSASYSQPSVSSDPRVRTRATRFRDYGYRNSPEERKSWREELRALRDSGIIGDEEYNDKIRETYK